MNTPVLDTLLESLYDGVMAPAGFQRFTEQLTQTFALKAATLITHHVQTHEIKGLWLHGVSQIWLERYALEFASEDMLAQHILASPIAHFYASNLDIPNPEHIPQTRFYREWLVPQGVAYAAGAIVLHEGSWCTQLILQRSPDHEAFSRKTLQQLDALIPHMQRALQMRQRFTELQMGQDFLAGGLDVLAMPTFLFDEYGRVAYLNQRAKTLLKHATELQVEEGHLTTVTPTLTRQLNLEIGNAIRASRGAAVPLNEIMLLPRQDQLPLMLMIAPMKIGQPEPRQGAALLFAFDPSQMPDLTVNRVRKLFNLTPAEAELAIGLCSGKTLENLTLDRQVSLHTVKSQLKSIFAKTGTKRQTELVSLLLASPACFLE